VLSETVTKEDPLRPPLARHSCLREAFGFTRLAESSMRAPSSLPAFLLCQLLRRSRLGEMSSKTQEGTAVTPWGSADKIW